MEFKAKPDWEACKEKFKAWWAHENFGRAGIQITCRKRGSERAIPPDAPKDPADRWTDKDFIKKQMDFHLEHTFFGGEAFPVWNLGYPGWDSIPSFLGCDIYLDGDTGWWRPVIDKGELRDYDPARFGIDETNAWYMKSRAYRAFALSESMGRAVPSTGAFGGAGDTLAALRTTERLLYDLKDDPEAVSRFEKRLMEIWINHYETVHNDLKAAADGGSSGWFELWSPGKFYAAQCDFAYMISPADFERCFLPAIDAQTRYLDHSIYHVDGLGNYAHVDALCSLPRLQALQILPGAGKPSPLAYKSVLEKVQKAGKNLHISIPPDEVKSALDMLEHTGLMIHTYAANQDEAEDIIRLVERDG